MQPHVRTFGRIAFRHGGAEARQQARQQARVGQARHVAQPHRLGRQQGRGHQLDGGILGAGNGDVPVKRVSALNGDAIHNASVSTRRPTGAESRFYMTDSAWQRFFAGRSGLVRPGLAAFGGRRLFLDSGSLAPAQVFAQRLLQGFGTGIAMVLRRGAMHRLRRGLFVFAHGRSLEKPRQNASMTIFRPISTFCFVIAKSLAIGGPLSSPY